MNIHIPESYQLRPCRYGPFVYNPNDLWIGRALERYGEWSWGEVELFRQLVRPGSIVVEVGANIGTHTVELSRMAGPEGEVWAFEPQPLVFQALSANLLLNRCHNVKARQEAVGNGSGSVVVPVIDPTIPHNGGGLSLRSRTPEGPQKAISSEQVPLISLDSLDLPACHLIKADVEGMEADVVRGAAATIQAYRPILYLENDKEDRSPELLELVLGLGYVAYWHLPPLYNPTNFRGDLENVFPHIVSINLLCVPQEADMRVDGMRPAMATDHPWGD